MTKQRPQSKQKPRATDVAPEHRTAPQGADHGRPTSAASPGSSRRATYGEAVALYERGVEALQSHDYGRALTLLRSVLERYPDEKELHERVRLYINICERHAQPKASVPQTVQERLYASTLAINGGKYDEAISHLRLVRDEDPDNDHALYMLAVAHTQRGEFAEAVAHLQRSIALNPENRALARRDADLDPLREDDAFLAAVDAAYASGDDSRAFRQRTAR